MSMTTALRAIGRQVDNPTRLGRAVDELLAARTEPPALLALGEPTHGIAAFPLLRNELLGQLVERGYRSIVLETDAAAASVVEDYVGGAPVAVDTVLATGFSHGFGALPANRELVEWLRGHNASHQQQDRVHFHGFDAPVEYAGAPSPRRALSRAVDFLPTALRPESAGDLDALLGADADWTNQAAMYDPAASIGNSDRARALRIVADDLGSALRRAAPGLRSVDPSGFTEAEQQARTGLGLLRYHAAMASTAPDRIAVLLSHRGEMMAENLMTILAREQRRGPSLVFAHNAHLQRAQPHLLVGRDEVSWASAGALVGVTLGERYVFLATDANPDSEPGTFQGVLAAATTHRTLFPAAALRTALAPSIRPGEPIVPGHLPLNPAGLDGVDAVIFVADTDGKRQQYW